MSDLKADQAYRKFNIPESSHSKVLYQASFNRPWTPEIFDTPGVKIDEEVYAEGILQKDSREKQDRHDLLIDGRLERYRKNIAQGKNKWDVVFVEQDFYQHPEEFSIDDSFQHNRNPENQLRKGDADLLFMDLDGYNIHIVEAKPHDGCVQNNSIGSPEALDSSTFDTGEFEDLEAQIHPAVKASGTSYSSKTEAGKKVRNLSEAWQTIIGELENDWTLYHPEFVFGSDVLDTSTLSQNPEYALPPIYNRESGYLFGTEEGFEKAEDSSDLESLNDTFFRGEITGLLEGERPQLEREEIA